MTKLPSIDQDVSSQEDHLSKDKKDQENQQFEKEKIQNKKETSFQLNALKQQLKKSGDVHKVKSSVDIKNNDEANSFLETELERIDVQESRLESNEKESHTQKSKHKTQSLDVNQQIAANVLIAHKAIEDLGRPEATEWLKASYDESQSVVTDFMWIFLTDKDLGFFS